MGDLMLHQLFQFPPSRRDRVRTTRSPAIAGFTLIELLTVIGIIAILIAILLPVLSSARLQANNLRCSARLSEIGRAFHLYSTTWKGVVPAPVASYSSPARLAPWQVLLWTYLVRGPGPTNAELIAGKHVYLNTTVFVCPLGVLNRETGDYASMGYAMNENLPGVPRTTFGPALLSREFKRLNRVRNSSVTLLVADGNNVNVSATSAGDKDAIVGPTGNVFDVVAHPRHQNRHRKGRIYVLMVDGSVHLKNWIYSHEDIPVPGPFESATPETWNASVVQTWFGRSN